MPGSDPRALPAQRTQPREAFRPGTLPALPLSDRTTSALSAPNPLHQAVSGDSSPWISSWIIFCTLLRTTRRWRPGRSKPDPRVGTPRHWKTYQYSWTVTARTQQQRGVTCRRRTTASVAPIVERLARLDLNA